MSQHSHGTLFYGFVIELSDEEQIDDFRMSDSTNLILSKYDCDSLTITCGYETFGLGIYHKELKFCTDDGVVSFSKSTLDSKVAMSMINSLKMCMKELDTIGAEVPCWHLVEEYF